MFRREYFLIETRIHRDTSCWSSILDAVSIQIVLAALTVFGTIRNFPICSRRSLEVQISDRRSNPTLPKEFGRKQRQAFSSNVSRLSFSFGSVVPSTTAPGPCLGRSSVSSISGIICLTMILRQSTVSDGVEKVPIPLSISRQSRNAVACKSASSKSNFDPNRRKERTN
jgi:hypothetical protein